MNVLCGRSPRTAGVGCRARTAVVGRIAGGLGRLQANSTKEGKPTAVSTVEDCTEDTWLLPFGQRDVVVALGKFDALHRGHKSLAVAASKMGSPVLLSFSGMAEVLKWPVQLPLVAPVDRARVLESWTDSCSGRCPQGRSIPFHMIRHLSPEEFVKLLAHELQASGVVAGSNYRFGFQAKGTADALVKLGQQYGLKVQIVDIVHDSGATGDSLDWADQQPPDEIRISSTRIRQLLTTGSVHVIESLLGRAYRIVCQHDTPAVLLDADSGGDYGPLESLLDEQTSASSNGRPSSSSGTAPVAACADRECNTVFLPKSTFLNLPPALGAYRASFPSAAALKLDLEQNLTIWSGNGASAAEWQGAFDEGMSSDDSPLAALPSRRQTFAVRFTEDGLLVPALALQKSALMSDGKWYLCIDLHYLKELQQ